MKALVIGGTGPTGHYVVNGLLQRGYTVAILHTGNHEVEEIPPVVEHIHISPYDEDALAAVFSQRSFDLLRGNVWSSACHSQAIGGESRTFPVSRWPAGIPRLYEPGIAGTGRNARTRF